MGSWGYFIGQLSVLPILICESGSVYRSLGVIMEICDRDAVKEEIVMSRAILVFTLILSLVGGMPAYADYQRNVARPVDKVVYGTVESVRGLTEQQVVHARNHGWNTLLGSLVGGIVGHQFGRGQGQILATATGVIAGASIARGDRAPQLKEYRLVELLIRTQAGELIDVIQDPDSNMVFSTGNEVRILYFSDGVRVDRAY
jgi:outer membrane lipoprotein SlyB